MNFLTSLKHRFCEEEKNCQVKEKRKKNSCLEKIVDELCKADNLNRAEHLCVKYFWWFGSNMSRRAVVVKGFLSLFEPLGMLITTISE